ncbi:toprim domain-containing protein [Streptomyces sp. WZ-12]|uniref:toprim domain-containing protein n=1 Tax=Streptomyces sp. WZ-12 TaxID=3030210 RepID=UPI002380F887|nr:toprim domain-containing protein [Streptomyces sp. WZ-12]
MHGTDRASATAWIASKGTIGRALRLLRGSEEEESDSPEVTEAHLALFTDPPETARRQRGLTLASCQKYGVLWDQHRECWILPIRDGDGQLLGWQEKSRRHFRNFPDGVAKGTTLFGGHIGTTPTLVMVESPLDTVRMDSVGIEGGRATYGVHVTPEQIRQAMNTSSCIILAQDNDRPGRKARAKLYRTYRCRGTRLLYWDYSECTAKDPGEMNAFELYDAYDAAYSPLTRRLTLRQ